MAGGNNNAQMSITLNTSDAMNKSKSLSRSITQIGTEGTGAGAKVKSATTQINTSLQSVTTTASGTRTAVTSIGTASTATSTMVVANNAKMATSFAAVGTAAASSRAGLGATAMGMQGVAIAGALAFTSLSNYDKAALKLQKSKTALLKTDSMILYYQGMINDMVARGKTNTTIYAKYVRDLDIAQIARADTLYKLSIAEGNVQDVNIQMGISLGLVAMMAAQTIIPLTGLTGAMIKTKVSSLAAAISIKTVRTALTALITHPALLIGLGIFLAWELAISSIVENMLGMEKGSLSVMSNVNKMLDSLAGGTEISAAYGEELVKAEESQKALEAGTDILADSFDGLSESMEGAVGGLNTFNNSLEADIKKQEQFTKSVNDSTKAVVNFKKKRLINPALMGGTYTGIAGGSMSKYGNLYQKGSAMGNRYYSGGSGGWTAQDQASKEGRMASNMAASQSRNRARLDARDNLMNALRGAGLKGQLGRDGTFTMGLSDGSQIRTIRGHLTGKYRKNDKAKGFAGGDELQGSFMQGGRDAWAKYQEGVSGVLKRNARPNVGKYGGWGKYGSLQKTLQRERMKYQEELKQLVKAMIIRQLKDKENNDAEIERLRNLDGSKAKEYYNKVGTHEAYDVYDRVNYRDYKTNMEGGATANI